MPRPFRPSSNPALRRSVFVLPIAAVAVFACSSAQKPVDKQASDPAARVETPEDVTANANAAAPGKPQPGEEVREFDFNNDKRPDVYRFYAEGTGPKSGQVGGGGEATGPVMRDESDLNGDGRIDVWNWFDRDGLVERKSYDLDFDGKLDAIAFFEKGVVVRKEFFHSFGDRPDTFKYYEKGKLTRIERDGNGDGRIDSWEYWENEQIDRIGEDVNADGTVDRWIKPKK